MTVLKYAGLALLLVGSAGPLRSQLASDPCATAPASCATTISTRATSRTRIPNNAVDITFGIRVTEKTADGARRKLTDATAMLMNYLHQQSVTRLATAAVSFEPQTHTPKNGPDQIVGYTGSATVNLRSDPEYAPDLLANALAHGANSIDNVNFVPREEDVARARQQMATAATQEALEQAGAIAKAAGLKVLAARSIQVENSDFPRGRAVVFAQRAMAPAMETAAAPIPTAAGDEEISVSVDIVVAAAH